MPVCLRRKTGSKYARVEYEYMPEYEGEGPMLYADYVEKAEPIEEIVQF